MPADVSTTVTELPESRVRVEAEVPAAEVEKRVAQAAKQLGRNLRVPGFRTGKVPPPVIIQRVGRDAVLDEAVRESIAGWYSAAIDRANVVPVGEPELNLAELPGEGEPLRFSIEIGVRPEAKLGDYEGLEVGRREANVGDEAIQAEVEALRERSAKLETTDRAAASGDFVVMDFLGTLDGEPFPGGEGRDQMVELGSGRLVPGFEEQLEGATAGDERTVKIEFPDDYGAAELAGREAEFAVTRQGGQGQGPARARRRPRRRGRLRHARRAARGHPRAPLRGPDRADRRRVPRGGASTPPSRPPRSTCPDALDRRPRARAVGADGPHALATRGSRRRPTSRSPARARTRSSPRTASRPAATCAARPCSPPSSRPRASRPPTRSCSSRSSAPPPPSARSPKKLFERLRSSGRLDSLRDELAQRKAIDRIADSAKPISVEQAQAREKLWTPGRRRARKRPRRAVSGRPEASLLTGFGGGLAVARLAPVERV